MDSKDLAKVALKVFSIYIMVSAILTIPSFYQGYLGIMSDPYSSANWFTLITTTSLILLFVLAIFVWRLSTSLTGSINTESNTSSSCISEEFLLSLLGLYLVFDGLTKICFSSISFYYKYINSNNLTEIMIQNMVYLSSYLILTIIGVTLVIKSNGWASLLHKLRTAGIR